MEIQSAFSAGVQGLQRASSGITAQDSAADSAANNSRNDLANRAQTSTTPTTPSLTDSLVQLNTEAVNAAANTRSIRTADEMLGTLIDVSV